MLSRKSVNFRKFFSGKPVILLDPDGINFENLRKVNMNFNDLTEGIHNAGYFNLEELLYVILQTNGTLTIVNRAPYAPLTASDLQIEKDEATLPIIIVTKGKVIKENTKLANIDENFILEQAGKVGIKNIKDILIMTINNLGKIYIQPRNGSFSSIESNHTGGNW